MGNELTDYHIEGADEPGLVGLAQAEDERRAQQMAKRELRQEWRPSADPETVLFIPGKYGENGADPAYINYCSFVKTAGRNRNGAVVHCRCQGGKLKGVPCVLCHEAKKDLKSKQEAYDKLRAEGHGRDAKRPRSMLEPSVHYAFTVIRLSWFHRVEHPGKNGGRSWTDYERCPETDEVVAKDATDCPHCINGVPRTFGLRRFFNAGYGYYESLLDIERDIGRKCKTCGGKIIVQKYICRHCYKDGKMTTLMDPKTTQMRPEDRATFWKKRVKCAVCDREAKPLEVIKCSNDCGKPRRRKLWDVWLTLHRQGGEKTSSIVKDGEFDPPALEDYPENIRKMMVPYDFEKMFYVDCDEQAELLHCPNPFAQGEIPDSKKGSSEGSVEESLAPAESVDY